MSDALAAKIFELISTLGTLPTRGGPVQGPVLTMCAWCIYTPATMHGDSVGIPRVSAASGCPAGEARQSRDAGSDTLHPTRQERACPRLQPRGLGFSVSGFVFRVSGFVFWVSRLEFLVPGFGFRGQGSEFRRIRPRLPLPSEEGTTQKLLRTSVWKPRPESGLVCLIRAIFARDRIPATTCGGGGSMTCAGVRTQSICFISYTRERRIGAATERSGNNSKGFLDFHLANKKNRARIYLRRRAGAAEA